MGTQNPGEMPGSVKFIARRVITKTDASHERDMDPFSSSERDQSQIESTGTNRSMDFAMNASTANLLSDPRQDEARIDHGQLAQLHPAKRLSGSLAIQKRNPPQDNQLDRLPLSKSRPPPSKASQNVSKRAKYSKAQNAAVTKRVASHSKRPKNRTVEHCRRDEAKVPGKARPPGGLDLISSSSDPMSHESAVVSERSRSASPEAMDVDLNPNEKEVEVLLQPQTRPITLEQLVVEVRTIYEGVVQFEDKAIRIDEEQTHAAQVNPKTRKPMSRDDYMSYIALHKALLHEHHDLCLASQHPAASASLRQLPARYSIPARMWRHGVHAPLEILRMRLPESREHMIAFILISFNHMTLFLETVPQFEATWLECIGDLGRYRLALAENDEERETFSGIARHWYHRAIQLNPQISRLYHHCAILAPSFSIEQLSLYGRALTGLIPFLPTRKSITALFRPILDNDEDLNKQISPALWTLLRAHAFLALGGSGSRAGFNQCLTRFQGGLLVKIVAEAADLKQDTRTMLLHLALAGSASLLQYGVTRRNGTCGSLIRLALDVSSSGSIDNDAMIGTFGASSSPASTETLTPAELEASRMTVRAAACLTFGMLTEALHNAKEENLHTFVHINIVLILSFTKHPGAIRELETSIPWKDIATFLNIYANAASMTIDILSANFPGNAGGGSEPLPEDYVFEGLVIAKDYLPLGRIENCSLDFAEQGMEKPFMTAARLQRILWAGHKISQAQKWLLYDDTSRKFSPGFRMDGIQIRPDSRDFVRSVPDLVTKQ